MTTRTLYVVMHTHNPSESVPVRAYNTKEAALKSGAEDWEIEEVTYYEYEEEEA